MEQDAYFSIPEGSGVVVSLAAPDVALAPDLSLNVGPHSVSRGKTNGFKLQSREQAPDLS